MDREITSEVRRRRVVKQAAAAVIGIAAVVFFFAATVSWLRPSIDRDDVQTALVQRGAVEATLQASGTVVPLVEQVVSSPVEARVLRIGRRAGDRVSVGDELLTLDTSQSRLQADSLRERVVQKESANAQLRLRLDESIASLVAQIEQKKLDVQILRYTADQKKKLGDAGLAAEQETLAATAMAKKSEIELRQLEEALVRTRRSRDAELNGAQTDLNIARREYEASVRELELAMLRAERNGVLTSIVSEEGVTVRRGDVLARVADLSTFRVESTISDVHASKIASGMRARVKIDERTSMYGTVAAVDPRIDNGVVRFFVDLDQSAHAALRNNMRVDVMVVTTRRDRTLRIRRGALGQKTSVFVVRNDSLVRIPVRWGLAGDEAIEVIDGLQDGDEVVISDMSDYDELHELRLK